MPFLLNLFHNISIHFYVNFKKFNDIDEEIHYFLTISKASTFLTIQFQWFLSTFQQFLRCLNNFCNIFKGRLGAILFFQPFRMNENLNEYYPKKNLQNLSLFCHFRDLCPGSIMKRKSEFSKFVPQTPKRNIKKLIKLHLNCTKPY